uniref:Uncharacterized protein n=1 Tax=Stomoxys calcitrans TaxID=35570 RepID=A0A1I8PTH6_STOCA
FFSLITTSSCLTLPLSLESLCSSKTQSTAVATQKLQQQQQQQQQQPEWPPQKSQSLQQNLAQLAASNPNPHQHFHHSHSHSHIHQHQHQHQHLATQQQQQQQQPHQFLPQVQHLHQHLNNEQRSPREYIDVPLPKSVVKSIALRNVEDEVTPPSSSSPFMLKYNACQPVNNINISPHSFETSMFSLHSSGQDSGVDFVSSRELYETSPDSFDSQTRKTTHKSLCPRHAKEHMDLKHNKTGVNGNKLDTDSRKASLVAASVFRGGVDPQQRGAENDLMQNSPGISLRARGHILRNSMNDLEQRLHKLEQSFKRPPLDYKTKDNSLQF